MTDFGLNEAQTVIFSVAILAVLAILIGWSVAIMRKGNLRGYRFGPDVVVRCRDGHLYLTTWLPLGSVKAIRLGLSRIQYCPVGDHVTLVTLMKDSELTPAERLEASRHRDSGVP